MKKFFISLFLFFIISGFVLQDDYSEFVDKFFSELDVNKDGTIDKKDIQKYSKREFKLIDINKDNIISRAEFYDFVCKKSCIDNVNCDCNNINDSNQNYSYLKEFFDRIDGNNNNEITPEEKIISDINDFYSFDLNNDGKITIDEIETKLY